MKIAVMLIHNIQSVHQVLIQKLVQSCCGFNCSCYLAGSLLHGVLWCDSRTTVKTNQGWLDSTQNPTTVNCFKDRKFRSINYSRNTSKKCSLIVLRKETHLISRCLNQIRRTPLLIGLMCLHTLQLSSYSQIRARTSIHSGGTPPKPRHEKGSLGILTLQATVLTLSLDLFCLCCINSFSFYQGSLCCRPALTVCFDPPSGKTVPRLASVPFVLFCLTIALRIDICHKNTHIVLSM